MQPITMMLLRFGEDILITLEKMKTSRDELMNNNERYFFLKAIWSVQKCSSFTPTLLQHSRSISWKKPFVYVTVQEYIQNMSENSAFLKEKG